MLFASVIAGIQSMVRRLSVGYLGHPGKTMEQLVGLRRCSCGVLYPESDGFSLSGILRNISCHCFRMNS